MLERHEVRSWLELRALRPETWSEEEHDGSDCQTRHTLAETHVLLTDASFVITW